LARIANRKALLVLAAVFIVTAWGKNYWTAESPTDDGRNFKLSSSAFVPGGTIPRLFSCDGSDISPALKWTEPPHGSKSLALIVDDPDAPAGVWVHWVLYDLPASARGLPQSVPKDAELEGGARQGLNDFRHLGYGGPCPPRGPAHRYIFKLYSLDTKLGLEAGATKAVLEKAMKGHILARAELIGRYGR
jgi:Raf kinase inhibitor-like YbhB/YbcL family protein